MKTESELSERETQRPRRPKSKELVELETLVNSAAIHSNRDVDFRFIRPRSFRDHTDGELIFSILAYIGLLGGTGAKSQSFRGVEAQYHDFHLIIKVDVSLSGRPEAKEDREVIYFTATSFASFKKMIDEL